MPGASGDHTSVQSAASPVHREIQFDQSTSLDQNFPSDTTTDMNVLKDRVRKTLEGKASIYKYERRNPLRSAS